MIERQAIFLEHQLLQLKARMPTSLHRKEKMLKYCHFFTNHHPELTNAPDSPPHTSPPSSKPYEPNHRVVMKQLCFPTSSAIPTDPPSKLNIRRPTCANGHNLTEDEEYNWHSVFIRLSRDFQSVCLKLAQLELELALVELRLDIRYRDRRNCSWEAFRTTAFELTHIIYDAIALRAGNIASKWWRADSDCCSVTLV